MVTQDKNKDESSEFVPLTRWHETGPKDNPTVVVEFTPYDELLTYWKITVD
jgi:hypothetical protein